MLKYKFASISCKLFFTLKLNSTKSVLKQMIQLNQINVQSVTSRAFRFVFLAATGLVVALSAVCAFTHMNSLVLFQRPGELEALPAMRALPRPLAGVAQHVVLQVRRVLVSLSASLAGEGTFARVHALVSLHVPDLREGFPAHLAAERTLSGVYAQVAPQHLRPCKSLVTKGARDLHPGSLVVPLMLFQVKHVDERLAADGTQVLALTCMIAFVSSEEAGVYETFPTQVTLVGALHGMVADMDG